MIWNFVVGGVAGWLLANFMNAEGDEVDNQKENGQTVRYIELDSF